MATELVMRKNLVIIIFTLREGIQNLAKIPSCDWDLETRGEAVIRHSDLNPRGRAQCQFRFSLDVRANSQIQVGHLGPI